MAGRGCTVTIEVLHDDGEMEEVSLPVALHTPLYVLKGQLFSMVGIPVEAQVWILFDMTDPDRNSDEVLEADDLTLRECGIRNASILSLHRLGNAPPPPKITEEVVDESEDEDDFTRYFGRPKDTGDMAGNYFSLPTETAAEDADHSYNGIVFDIKVRGAYELQIKSISLAGMLGRIRIFVRPGSWRDSCVPRNSEHWWAHSESLSSDGWTESADQTCAASWDAPFQIDFRTPAILLPGESLAIYCHSALPNDLGIQYQSYGDISHVVASSPHLLVYPGLGHTSSVPFDEQNGWYRSYRGLTGEIGYQARLKGWSIFTHSLAPTPLKSLVYTMLRAHIVAGRDEYMPPSLKKLQATASSSSSSSSSALSVSDSNACRYSPLTTLPLEVLYYIMEFMHWDWFLDDKQQEVRWSASSTYHMRPVRGTYSHHNRNRQEDHHMGHAMGMVSADDDYISDHHMGHATDDDYISDFPQQQLLPLLQSLPADQQQALLATLAMHGIQITYHNPNPLTSPYPGVGSFSDVASSESQHAMAAEMAALFGEGDDDDGEIDSDDDSYEDEELSI